jgi:hypothetical protein
MVIKDNNWLFRNNDIVKDAWCMKTEDMLKVLPKDNNQESFEMYNNIKKL